MDKKRAAPENRRKSNQVKFYLSDSDFARLELEKIRRNSSYQELMERAVERLFQDLDFEEDVASDARKERKRDMQRRVLGIEAVFGETFSLREGERPWVELFIKMLRELPVDTVVSFQKLLKDLVRFFDSSRLTSGRGDSA